MWCLKTAKKPKKTNAEKSQIWMIFRVYKNIEKNKVIQKIRKTLLIN